MRARKDINQTSLGGQHHDPTVSLINAVETTCQGNSWTMFYYQRFSKSSKKFDLNSLGPWLSGWGDGMTENQHVSSCHSSAL
jgi:hypothetical protein